MTFLLWGRFMKSLNKTKIILFTWTSYHCLWYN